MCRILDGKLAEAKQKKATLKARAVSAQVRVNHRKFQPDRQAGLLQECDGITDAQFVGSSKKAHAATAASHA